MSQEFRDLGIGISLTPASDMTAPIPAAASQTPPKQGRFWRLLVHAWFRLFRSDIFISYTRSDRGRNYAHALASALRNRKFEVLMDTFEARQSEETPELLLDRMRCTMQMVVVASPGAVKSKEVAREIQLFPKRGRSIVLLEFDEDVRAAPWYRLYLSGLPPVPAEDAEAADSSRGGLHIVPCTEGLLSAPSEATLDLIVNAFRYKRQRLREAVLAGLVAAVTLGLLLSAGVLWGQRSRISASLKQEHEKFDAAQRSRKEFEQNTKRQLADGEAKARYQQQLTQDAESATTAARAQQREAEIIRDHARTERDAAIQQQTVAVAAKQQAEQERKKAEDSLRIAKARAAATNALESDPVVAYRLAEYVYDHNAENRNKKSEARDAKLIRQAASRARFPYAAQFRGCYLTHDWTHWALLACEEQKGNRVLKVINLDTGKVDRELPYPYPFDWGVWITPNGESWRILGVRPDGERVAIEAIDPSGAEATLFHDTVKIDFLDLGGPLICGPVRAAGPPQLRGHKSARPRHRAGDSSEPRHTRACELPG